MLVSGLSGCVLTMAKLLILTGVILVYQTPWRCFKVPQGGDIYISDGRGGIVFLDR